MKCILDNRATGKTTKLVNEMLKWKNSILLVHCHDFAKVIEERFPKSKGRVFSWNTYIKHKNNKKLIFIDNAEYFWN